MKPRRLAVLALALVGCRAAPVVVEPAAPVSTSVAWSSIGTSVEGRPLRCARFGAGEVVLLVAGIHGDEAAGTPLLERLALELAEQPAWAARRCVIVVPDLNPDGLASGERRNARGVDLNRNFPAANFRERDAHGGTPLSEPEARALHALILEERPARILSFHQPIAVIDWDGPAEALAHVLAAACELPAKRIGSRPGSLGSWSGVDLAIPTVTVELPRAADEIDVDEAWARYGPMLIAAIAFDG